MSYTGLHQMLVANIGTCGYCGKLFKVKPGKGDTLANHGFRRPQGWRMLVGSCAAAGMRCLEVSPETLDLAISHTEAFLAQRQSYLTQLHAGAVDRIEGGAYGEDVNGGRAHTRAHRVCTPAHKDWARALRAEEESVARTIRFVTRDLDEARLALAKWAPTPERIKRDADVAAVTPAELKEADRQAREAHQAELAAALAAYRAAAEPAYHHIRDCETCSRTMYLDSAELCEEGQRMAVAKGDAWAVYKKLEEN